MVDWLKDFQSKGRGIRNGEFNVAMSGNGKFVILDMESQGLEPTFEPGLFRHYSTQHWCHNAETGKWTHHTRRPFHEYISASDQIIIKGDDGKFYWYKDRYGGRHRELDEQELKDLTFVLLGAEHVEPDETKWLNMKVYRPIGNPCNEILLK